MVRFCQGGGKAIAMGVTFWQDMLRCCESGPVIANISAKIAIHLAQEKEAEEAPSFVTCSAEKSGDNRASYRLRHFEAKVTT